MQEHTFDTSLEHAVKLDQEDPLSEYRAQFLFPSHGDNDRTIYLCGNSLGLQSRSVESELGRVLKNWNKRAVEGHFEGKENWIGYNDRLKPLLAPLIGAETHEVAIANTLTVNLHLMMISFYRPDKKRYKILIEKDAFPSDKYVVASQLKMHGIDPDEGLVEVVSSQNDDILRVQDFEFAFEQHKDEIALVLLGGINYFTGQFLPVKGISELCKNNNVIFGLDLAHAIGNVPVELNALGVDFAAWCHYKYLNAGPGAIGGFFIHEKHHGQDLVRLEGWWGNKLDSRFLMRDKFEGDSGAEAWVMSTPPTLSIAPLKASLEIFDEVGLQALRRKSVLLTSYLEYLLQEVSNEKFRIITPADSDQRGCQLSIAVKNADKSLFHALTDKGVMLDWREPNVIRVSPAPLYNSFQDVYHFVQILKDCL